MAVKMPESVLAFTWPEGRDQRGAADGEADPPAGHVEGLRQAVELDRHVLRAGDLEDARGGLVEVHLVVGGVLGDHEVVRLGQVDDLLEEGQVGRAAGRVVRDS